MKTLGEIIVGSHEGAPRPVLPKDEGPRLYRVTLCSMVFADVEVMANSPLEARRTAELNPPVQPQRKFRTAPAAHRTEVQGFRGPDGVRPWIRVEE